MNLGGSLSPRTSISRNELGRECVAATLPNATATFATYPCRGGGVLSSGEGVLASAVDIYENGGPGILTFNDIDLNAPDIRRNAGDGVHAQEGAVSILQGSAPALLLSLAALVVISGRQRRRYYTKRESYKNS